MSLPSPLPLFEPLGEASCSYAVLKAEAREFAERTQGEDRVALARAFCAGVLRAYWHAQCGRFGIGWATRPLPLVLPELPHGAARLADRLGHVVTAFPPSSAGYLAGSLYTTMLPESLRSSLGAYYTPPALGSRLLDLAESAGFDFATGTAIDPACGGGAFLAPVALRMLQRSRRVSPSWVIGDIARRLRGIEVDPFAAWMSETLLEAALLPVCAEARLRLPQVVETGDALRWEAEGAFDLVVGNPPYGRTTLEESLRRKYARSLFGHANLYGVFTDLALRLARPGGVVAYLTPTSFLGGQYFKSLREVLAGEATLVALDFVADRDGVFEDVLQETALAAYVKSKLRKPVTVSVTIPRALDTSRVELLGECPLEASGGPWLLPRSRREGALLDALRTMPTRLDDLGYKVSTGPLVWNRHKDQLRSEPGPDTYPLIWAESVLRSGFRFSANRRNHLPFFRVRKGQDHLLVRGSCVLVQRTTAKEQDRRLVAAVLPSSFLVHHGAAVVENHLNMIYAPAPERARISPEVLSALFNTAAVDRAFRCINGSVAVSAYELNALPLPSPEQMNVLARGVGTRSDHAALEAAAELFYGGVK